MRSDYSAAREAVRNILTPYNYLDIKAANKEMKKVFGNRLSQIKGGQTEATYYILVEEDGEWEMVAFSWDFFYHDFQ